MKKQITLFILLLFSIVSSAQSVKTEVPIIGLGEFELGMKEYKISRVLEKLAPNNPITSDYYSSFISARNLDLMGSTFDHCAFFFDEDKVYLISFTTYFDTPEEGSEEFRKLLYTLEENYGKQSLDGNNDYIWKNGQESVRIHKGYDQTKGKESVSIFCSTSDIQSLVAKSKLYMYGFGEFKFFSSVDEVEAALKYHITPNTKITKKKKLFSSEVKRIILTNVTLAGQLFDYCELEFDTEELRYITFEKYFDKKNKNPKEFDELLTILEKDYGIQENKENQNAFSWYFGYEIIGWVWLIKSYKKCTTITLEAVSF